MNAEIHMPTEDLLKINQVGYFPNGPKHVVFSLLDPKDPVVAYRLIDLDKQYEVYRGTLAAAQYWEDAEEWTRVGDFSEFTQPGRYKIEVAGQRFSHPFVIHEDLYGEALKAATRMFYYQRASISLDEAHAGRFAREAGHLNQSVRYHPDLGKAPDARLASPGGWYDAGDYGKYIVNAGVATSLLMMTYERFGVLFPDGSLNIPESGNGRSDLLDEIRYELDWFCTMQDTDGGVYFKVTPRNFAKKVLPADDTNEHLVIGKSTTSTLNFAAVLANASRIYESIDSDFSKRCLTMAEHAWQWAVEHPSVPYTQGAKSELYQDVNTGGYGDRQFEDEFLWAKVALYMATEDQQYAVALEDLPRSYRGPTWRDVSALALYTISLHAERFDGTVANRARQMIEREAARIVADLQAHPYRLCAMKFYWASNTVPLNAILTLSHAYALDPNTDYLHASIELMDYIFGKNAVGYSFVTGLGTKSSLNPHHRIMYADGIDVPIPGFLVGGPNDGRQDLKSLERHGGYLADAPAKSYVDHISSYASNEVAINWNAPLVYALSFIESLRGEL